ncbi:MAG TPA: branched-chain amino acid ABC transporter permease, partial [Burkholderiales bacterium]
MSRTQPIGLAVILVALALAPLVLKNYGIYLLTLWCVYVMAAMGLNLTVGYAGLISLGHAAFLGIGAYTAAILMKAGVAFGFVLPVAALLCFAAGLGLGFPALRVRHHYLAFATLGFNVFVFLFL